MSEQSKSKSVRIDDELADVLGFKDLRFCPNGLHKKTYLFSSGPGVEFNLETKAVRHFEKRECITCGFFVAYFTDGEVVWGGGKGCHD